MSVGVLLAGAGILWTLLYTVNFGRWAWSTGSKRAAIGIWLLAAAVVAAPLIVALRS